VRTSDRLVIAAVLIAAATIVASSTAAASAASVAGLSDLDVITSRAQLAADAAARSGAQLHDAGARITRVAVDVHVLSTAAVDHTTLVDSCTVATDGGTCTLSAEPTRVDSGGAQTALGMPVAAVVAALGLEQTASVATISCTSPPLRAGRSFHAWNVGIRYSYRLRTTRPLHAPQLSELRFGFVAHDNELACG